MRGSVGLFTYSTLPRGSVVHTAQLADALVDAGWDVTVYALDKDGRGFFRPLRARLRLVPITLGVIEAVLRRDRAAAEHALGATFPDVWPNEDLVAGAFPYSLEAIRAAPELRLWGDSFVLPLDELLPIVI